MRCELPAGHDGAHEVRRTGDTMPREPLADIDPKPAEEADTELEQPVATPEDPAPAEAEPGGERVELETPDETSGEVRKR